MPNALYSAVFLVERTLRPLIPTRSGLETMRCLPLASVLILGACSSSTEPHVGRWTSDAAMPTPRGLAVAGVIDGIVYVAGGYVSLTGAVATLEAYDPVANTWTTKAPMPVARYGTVAGVVNGILYVAGGQGGTSAPVYSRRMTRPQTHGRCGRRRQPRATPQLPGS